MLGAETGLLSGSASATRTITRDPDSRKRIEDAFRLFQVDVLKRQLNVLEGQGKSSGSGSDSGSGASSWDRLKEQAGGMVSSLRPSSDNI